MPEIFVARDQPLAVADHQLEIVVPEADEAKGERGSEHDPYEAVAQIRPEQRAEHDGDENQHTTHGGRALLRQM